MAGVTEVDELAEVKLLLVELLTRVAAIEAHTEVFSDLLTVTRKRGGIAAKLLFGTDTY